LKYRIVLDVTKSGSFLEDSSSGNWERRFRDVPVLSCCFPC